MVSMTFFVILMVELMLLVNLIMADVDDFSECDGGVDDYGKPDGGVDDFG